MDEIARSITESIKRLYQEARWEECISACAETISGGKVIRGDSWVTIAAAIGGAASNLDAARVLREYQFPAINALEALLDAVPNETCSVHVGRAFRSLGYLHGSLAERGRKEHEERAIQSYRRAGEVLMAAGEEEEAADVVVAMGNELLSRARRLTAEEIMDYSDSVTFALKSVDDAIRCYESALPTYERLGSDSDIRSIGELVVGAHDVRDILKRERRSTQ